MDSKCTCGSWDEPECQFCIDNPYWFLEGSLEEVDDAIEELEARKARTEWRIAVEGCI